MSATAFALPHTKTNIPRIKVRAGMTLPEIPVVILSLFPPPATKARELPITILLSRDGKPTGQLHRRIPVAR